MRATTKHILAVVASATALAVVVVPISDSFLRFAFGIAVVLLLPGYGIINAVAVEKQVTELDKFAYLGLYLSISIAVAIASGFILHISGAGLSAETLTITISSVAMIANAVAAIRSVRFRPILKSLAIRHNPKKPNALYYLIALVIFVAAFFIVSDGVRVREEVPFTQFWALGQPDDTILVGVFNREAETLTYRIVIEFNTGDVQDWDLELGNQDLWLHFIDLPEGATYARCYLYTSRDPSQPYRQVEYGIPTD